MRLLVLATSVLLTSYLTALLVGRIMEEAINGLEGTSPVRVS